MSVFIDLFFIGLVGAAISFVGQLPLGNLAVTATQIGTEENEKNAWEYAMGVALVEIIYLRISLSGVGWLSENEDFFILIQWFTVAVFGLLGCISFIAAIKAAPGKKGVLINNNMPRFFLGITMSAVNPAQIPFWFFWSSYLVTVELLSNSSLDFNCFTIGAGLGTLAGLALYIHGGKWLVQRYQISNKTLNIFLGIVFLVSALLQLIKILTTH